MNIRLGVEVREVEDADADDLTEFMAYRFGYCAHCSAANPYLDEDVEVTFFDIEH